MSIHRIFIEDSRFKQQASTKPELNEGGATSPTRFQNETKTTSAANVTAVAGAAYLGGKIVEAGTQIAMWELDKVGSRNGYVAQQARIQNSLNKFALGKKGVSYGKSVLAGAAAGAAVGSVIPGLGTAVGAGVGALVGLAEAGVSDYINFNNNQYERNRNNFETRKFEELQVWSNSNQRFAGRGR